MEPGFLLQQSSLTSTVDKPAPPERMTRSSMVFRSLRKALRKGSKGHSPEATRKLRVLVRKAQALAAMEPGATPALREALTALGRRLGRLRDWQVLDARIAALVIADPALAPAGPAVAEARERARRRWAAQDFKILVALLRDAESCPSAPAARLRLARLEQALRVVEAAIELVRAPSAEAWHGVRLAGKKLRYLLELAGEPPVWPTVLEALKALQAALGPIQDAERGEALLCKLASAQPQAAPALRLAARRVRYRRKQAFRDAETPLLDLIAALRRDGEAEEAR